MLGCKQQKGKDCIAKVYSMIKGGLHLVKNILMKCHKTNCRIFLHDTAFSIFMSTNCRDYLHKELRKKYL